MANVHCPNCGKFMSLCMTCWEESKERSETESHWACDCGGERPTFVPALDYDEEERPWDHG